MKIHVYHNIKWPAYKGQIFGELARLGSNLWVTHIAETERSRLGFGRVDPKFHSYPHEVLFLAPYEDVTRLSLLSQLTRSLLNSDADVVILPGYHRVEYWWMLLVLRLRRKRLGVFCDSTLMDRPRTLWKSLLKRLFFARVQGVFAYGSSGFQYLTSLGVSPDRIFIGCQAALKLPGYDPNEQVSRRLMLRRPTAPRSHRLLYVGRLSSEKNVECLLRALVVARSGDEPMDELNLVVVGSGPDEPRLRQLVQQLDLNNHVTFKGPLGPEQLQREYLASSCLVLPSLSEPWGLVVNEALSNGCPVLVSHRCGCASDLLSRATGATFDPLSPDDLLDALRSVLQGAPDSVECVRQRIDFVANFDPAAAAQRIYDGCQRIFLH